MGKGAINKDPRKHAATLIAEALHRIDSTIDDNPSLADDLWLDEGRDMLVWATELLSEEAK